MDITLYLLLSAGPVGAFDVIYFHLWKFRLYRRPESTKEEITHLCRALLFPIGLGILLYGRPSGLWFWVVAGLFAYDALNSLLDVIFEPASRAPLQVPPTELADHFIGTTMMGAAWATFMLAEWGRRLETTALKPHIDSSIPDWVFSLGYLALAMSVAVLLFEAALFARALLKRRSSRIVSSKTV
jgi:hypothetical protein